jgi:hypothetical protein
MFSRFDPVIAYGCGCGGSGGSGGSSGSGVGPTAPNYTSTKREPAPAWSRPARRRQTETPQTPAKPAE